MDTKTQIIEPEDFGKKLYSFMGESYKNRPKALPEMIAEKYRLRDCIMVNYAFFTITLDAHNGRLPSIDEVKSAIQEKQNKQQQ